jgi:asparagine synthase (glutamine-hydrolysing)
MAADVPVGLFLSGGLDSSTVGYYMTRLAGSRVKSFSVGFEHPSFDESAHGRAVAAFLGTDHHEEVFDASRVLNLVERLPDVLDEPMGDQSILPTMLVSTVARRSVTVALGGDGSDELLMGYTSYRALKAAWWLARVPSSLYTPARTAAHLYRGGEGRKRRVQELAGRLDASPTERLLRLLGAFGGDAGSVLTAPTPGWPGEVNEIARRLRGNRIDGGHPADETVHAYVRSYLQEDILPKVDRASMSTSLEVRVPFLDVDLADFILGLSPALRLRRTTGKYLLRLLMRGRLPAEVLNRRKMGFGAPIGQWLRNEMRDWAEDLLNSTRLKEQGLFDADAVGTLWRRHLEGGADESRRLWLILQFQQWCDRWAPEIPPQHST